MVEKEGIPDYLKGGWRESRWRRITRCRLRNEIRRSGNKEKQEKKRKCGKEEENETCIGKM